MRFGRRVNAKFYCAISKAYVKKLTRKGYPIAENNYAICMRKK